jgi:hypothetical protein
MYSERKKTVFLVKKRKESPFEAFSTWKIPLMFGKPLDPIIFGFTYPLNQIGSYSCIEGAISHICQNVYGGLLIHYISRDSGFRRNDEYATNLTVLESPGS